MQYRRCGASGLVLPAISLGCRNHFGDEADLATAARMLRTAVDHGVTHFDLANGYGPCAGAAERQVGEILARDLAGHRHELVVSTKAGSRMWPGPHGQGSSRKHLMLSIEQSLGRLGLDYIDLFYSSRFDPDTPLEETTAALADIVRQGKALYIGLCSYDGASLAEACRLLEEQGVPATSVLLRYSILNRRAECRELLRTRQTGAGVVAYSPLAEGLLSTRHLDERKDERTDERRDERRGEQGGLADTARDTVRRLHATPDVVGRARRLARLAARRGQTLPQMALAWVLRDGQVASALTGASSPAQIRENAAALDHTGFSSEELVEIGEIASAATASPTRIGRTPSYDASHPTP